LEKVQIYRKKGITIKYQLIS